MLGVGIAVLGQLMGGDDVREQPRRARGSTHLFGWAWDATLSDSCRVRELARRTSRAKVLDRDPNVDAWAGAFFGAATGVDGTNVPLLGVIPGASVHPPILEGRSIESAHEVVMGSSTLARLGKHVGDSVTIGDRRRRQQTLRIVGTAQRSRRSASCTARTHHSASAPWSTAPSCPGHRAETRRASTRDTNVIFVRFREGVDHGAAMARLRREGHRRSPRRTGAIEVFGALRPAEIVNASNIEDITDDPRRVFWCSRHWRRWPSPSARRSGAAATTSRCSKPSASPGASWRRRCGGRRAAGEVVAGVVGVPVGVVAGRWLWDVSDRDLDIACNQSTRCLLLLVIGTALVDRMLTGRGPGAASTAIDRGRPFPPLPGIGRRTEAHGWRASEGDGGLRPSSGRGGTGSAHRKSARSTARCTVLPTSARTPTCRSAQTRTDSTRAHRDTSDRDEHDSR